MGARWAPDDDNFHESDGSVAVSDGRQYLSGSSATSDQSDSSVGSGRFAHMAGRKRTNATVLVTKLVTMVNKSGNGVVSVEEGTHYLALAGHDSDDVHQNWASIVDEAPEDYMANAATMEGFISVGALIRYILQHAELDTAGFFKDEAADDEILGQVRQLELESGAISGPLNLELKRIDSISLVERGDNRMFPDVEHSR